MLHDICNSCVCVWIAYENIYKSMDKNKIVCCLLLLICGAQRTSTAYTISVIKVGI